MNRHQRKVLSLAAAIGNLALSVSVASVATYAWYSNNTVTYADGLLIQTSSVEMDLTWDILHYDDDIKAGKSYNTASEFYLQDYDVYLTQKNKYANCILVATFDIHADFTDEEQLYIDIYCQDGHAPAYGSACPAYTSNVCQFKTFAYSYKTTSDPVVLNNAVTTSSAATKYSTASSWFANTKSQYEKFVSVVNNTPYKRSNKITLAPDLSAIPASSPSITQLVIYIECSYNPQLVDYYINSYGDSLAGNYFTLAPDLTNIEGRIGQRYSGSYVRVESGTLTSGEYLIVNENNKVALDGSLTAFDGKNYADVHPIKNRIRKTEVTNAIQFTYNESAKTFASTSQVEIGFDGTNIATGSYAHSSASVSNGVANILYSGSNYLRFNNTENVTKFNYASNSSYQDVVVYKYDANADVNVYVSSIAVTTASSDLTFNRYDNFSRNGLVVTVTYNNGQTATVTNDCIYSVAGAVVTTSSPIPVSGSQTVSITYYDPDNSYYTASTSYTITVRDQILALSSTTLSGTGGLTTTLTATPTYFSGTPNYIWSSSNSSVVVVNGNGATATVVYIAEGSAVITCRATFGSQTATATCLVSVEDGIPVTRVTVAPSSITISRNNTTTLSASITPANATNQNVVWYSDDTAVATVNGSGVVTGVSAGTVNVFAFSDTNGNGTWEQGEPRGGCSVTVN